MNETRAGTHEIQPIVSEFNTRIDEIIQRKPFASEIDNKIFAELQGRTGKLSTFEASTLPLWGMAEVIRNQYGDTLGADRIKEHGIKIQKTAVYFAHKIQDGTITEGLDIAKTLSIQLFNYGESLVEGRPSKNSTPFNRIAEEIEKLSQEETQEVEHLLGIDEFFEPPMFSGDIDWQRKSILNDFFSMVGDHQATLPKEYKIQANQIQKAIETAIKKPAEEFKNSIAKKKKDNFLKKTPINSLDISKSTKILAILLKKDTQSIYQALELPTNRQQLEFAYNDPNKTEDDISNLEWQIALKIQAATTLLTSEEKINDKRRGNQRSDKSRFISAVTLGANLMHQTGIECFIGNGNNSSVLFLKTANHKMFLMDMTSPSLNSDVTDIIPPPILFNQNPKPEGLRIRIRLDSQLSKLQLNKEQRNSIFTLYTQKDGQRISTLFDKAITYRDESPIRGKDRDHDMDKFTNYQKSIKTFGEIVTPNLQDEDIWYQYGETLLKYANEENVYISDKSRENATQKATEIFLHVIKLNSIYNQDYDTNQTRIFNITNPHNRLVEARKQAQKSRNKQKPAA